MSANFYNTTHESGPTLLHHRSQAKAQYARVIDFYRAHPGELLGPSEVWRRTGIEAEGAPINSVRRAITDATKDKILVMTAQKTIGAWGRSEHLWVYPKQEDKRVSGSDLLL
jgi:hypothetical protein